MSWWAIITSPPILNRMMCILWTQTFHLLHTLNSSSYRINLNTFAQRFTRAIAPILQIFTSNSILSTQLNSFTSSSSYTPSITKKILWISPQSTLLLALTSCSTLLNKYLTAKHELILSSTTSCLMHNAPHIYNYLTCNSTISIECTILISSSLQAFSQHLIAIAANSTKTHFKIPHIAASSTKFYL